MYVRTSVRWKRKRTVTNYFMIGQLSKAHCEFSVAHYEFPAVLYEILEFIGIIKKVTVKAIFRLIRIIYPYGEFKVPEPNGNDR